MPIRDAFVRIKSKGKPIQRSDYQEKGFLPIVDQGQAAVAAYTDDASAKFQGPLPVIVFGDHTRNVKYIDFDFAVGAQGTVILRPIESILPKYFYWWLSHLPIHNLGYSRHYKILSEQTIAFPTIEEQTRIVARIDALTSRLSQLRQLRISAMGEANALLAAQQKITYERLLRCHPSVMLGNVGTVISGTTPSKANADYWDGDIPWIAPKEMKQFCIGSSSLFVTQKAVSDGVVKLVPPRSVLLVVRGMILARHVPVAVTACPTTINQDMKAFFSSEGFDATFLGHMLCGAESILLDRVETAGHGTRKLESSDWGSLPIPTPSIREQLDIAGRLDALAERVADLRAHQSSSDALLAPIMSTLLCQSLERDAQ